MDQIDSIEIAGRIEEDRYNTALAELDTAAFMVDLAGLAAAHDLDARELQIRAAFAHVVNVAGVDSYITTGRLFGLGNGDDQELMCRLLNAGYDVREIPPFAPEAAN